MAYLDIQPLETLLCEDLRQFVQKHAESRQSVDAASDVVHSLSAALKNLSLFPRSLHPSSFSSQLQDSLDWIKMHKFMVAQRVKNPYPSFLQRAHMYGELFPRFIDYMTERYCDSFVSDGHAMDEWQGESEIGEPIMGMKESLSTIAELGKEVNKHLLKTTNNKGKKTTDPYYHFSRFISLSGDMRWTLHTSYQKRRRQKAGQESGLAIFDTTIIMEHEAQLFRVSDLLLFLDKEPRYGGSAIEGLARYWAKNADEYICWDVIPKKALINFISCDTMTDGLAPERMFLRSEFRKSDLLGSFKQESRFLLSPDDYARRVSLFLSDIMHELSPTTNGDRLIEYLFATLCDPYHWGYQVTGDKYYMERKILAVVNAEYACGIGSWMLNDKFSIDLQHCADLRNHYLFKAERLLVGLNTH